MKSSVDCYDVTVDNPAVTVPKHKRGVGCYDVSMFGLKSLVCAGARVCAHEIIETSKHRNKSISMRVLLLRQAKNIETCRNRALMGAAA
jgi:hypothetical protein